MKLLRVRSIKVQKPARPVLSLPGVAEKPILLAATYAVVVFTIVVQGWSLRAVVERFSGPR
jgi:NhaP-type Na+/H+ or K+/H+ antiporter